MARARTDRRSATGPPVSGGVGERERQHRLLRRSRIFAAVVREILETKFLHEVSPAPLTLSQFHLLRVIGLNGTHHVGELASCLGVSPPAATKNLDKLERLGLIMRSPSKGDRRATLLSPSAKGRGLVRKYESLTADRLAPVLDEFSSKEIDSLARLLERFSVSLLNREQPGGGFCLRCGGYIEADCAVGRARSGCPYEEASRARAESGAIAEVS